MSEARYAVGIDLGTTHCAVSAVDRTRAEGGASPRSLEVPQTVAPGEVQARPLLPSFLYLPHEDELEPGSLSLPWNPTPGFAVGTLARELGERTPLRLVSSAKSWLCVSGVDRRAPILPRDVPETEVRKLSPFEAQRRYLDHLREAWNHGQPDAPLADQSVVVTVPASFDPAARELTAEAAREAGLGELTLLEEPQAAMYAWLAGAGEAFRDQVEVGDVILVVDVGGGTTDLSLIAVAERDGKLELHRVAVGDHILLGGDNMDLALAHAVAAKVASGGRQLDATQMLALTHACRSAKERILAEPDTDAVPIAVASRGSRLIGGSVRTELTREEVDRTLLDGFFPEVQASARPAARARAALTQLGLPYAQDPAVTRHLASFLAKQARATEALEEMGRALPAGATFVHPTAVLFNGGVFKASVLRERIAALIDRWLEAEGAPPVRTLEGAELDLACARGAAYYGWARESGGLRIRGGTARAYYVGVEAAVPAVPGIEPPLQAVCVAPFGLEEGSAPEPPPQELGLVVGEPVRFRFFGSSVRREDEVGTVLETWEDDELVELGAIEAELPAEGHPAGDVVPVRLRARVTEVGTLRLEAVPQKGDTSWKVELDVRGASGPQ